MATESLESTACEGTMKRRTADQIGIILFFKKNRISVVYAKVTEDNGPFDCLAGSVCVFVWEASARVKV